MNAGERHSRGGGSTKKSPKEHGTYERGGDAKQTMSYKGKADPRFSGTSKPGGSTKQTGTVKRSGETKQYGNYKKGSTRYAGAL